MLPVVAAHRADALPGWLYQVSVGIGYAHPDPAAPRSAVVRDVLAAMRLGLDATATDPEIISGDPLSDAASLMFRSFSESLEPATAAQYVTAVFSDLEPEDRNLVARVILT